MMTPRHLRKTAGRKENVAAAVISGTLAAGVGLVAFYFTRLFLSREPVDASEAGDRLGHDPGEGQS
jgi:hypothetical protein